MKKPESKNKKQFIFRGSLMFIVLLFLLYGTGAFIIDEAGEAFFKQFGVTKTVANEKIVHGFLDGFLDTYGLESARNIALNDRKEVILTLLNHVRAYVSEDEFKTAYGDLRDRNKPEKQEIRTPESLQEEMVSDLIKSISETEAALKQADESVKPAIESALAMSEQMLGEARDPNNAVILAYRQNYDYMVMMNEQSYQQQIGEWNRQYPLNHLLFVKIQLQQFMKETENIDFAAQVVKKDDKLVFVNPVYEGKNYHWKMAFRAGKEVVLPAREFVSRWIQEIQP